MDKKIIFHHDDLISDDGIIVNTGVHNDDLISDDGINVNIDVNNNETIKENEQDKKIKSLLYSSKVTCPVCDNVFDAATVKSSAYRSTKKDSDFFIRYSLINPYFYDVWVCDSCGYAAMKSDFNTLRKIEIDQVYKRITPKWRGRTYPEIYDVHIAIERYKLSLLNYVVINASSSKKAINCLKLAWMYRLLETDSAKEMELKYLNQALEGLSKAYYVEDFPLYGMDKYSIMYLIGELSRRTGHAEDSLIWFSSVITTPTVKESLKRLARDMKDLIKVTDPIDTKVPDESKKTKKSGFISKLFKR